MSLDKEAFELMMNFKPTPLECVIFHRDMKERNIKNKEALRSMTPTPEDRSQVFDV